MYSLVLLLTTCVYNIKDEAEARNLALLLLCREEQELEKVAMIPWKVRDILARIEQLASPDEIIPRGALGVRQYSTQIDDLESMKKEL